jgi:hypothetical protein
MLKILVASVILLTHPVHVSVLSIDFVPEIDSFKVFTSMYLDDFLLDYRLNGGSDQNLNIAEGGSGSEEQICRYMNDKVILHINDRHIPGRISNIEVSDGEIKMNLLYESPGKTRRVLVKNLIMTGLYSDQTNMVILRVNDFEEGVKLTPGKTEQTFLIK